VLDRAAAFFVATMIASQLGLGVVQAFRHSFRDAVIAMLLAVVNVLVFWR